MAPSRLSCSSDCNEDPFDVHCVPTTSVADQWKSLKIIQQQGWVLARTFVMEALEDSDLVKFFAYNASNPVSLPVFYSELSRKRRNL